MNFQDFFVGQRVSDITPASVSSFLSAARSSGVKSVLLLTDSGLVSSVCPSDATELQSLLGVVCVTSSAWIRTDASALGVWCGLQAWPQELTAQQDSVEQQMRTARALPGVGGAAVDLSTDYLLMAQEWAGASGFDAVEINVDPYGTVTGIFPICEFVQHDVESGEYGACVGVQAHPSAGIIALRLRALLWTILKR